MVGWNDLPVKSKKEVMKRLDFMSRHSMRSTCRENREIVDSNKFEVPRARFAVKNADEYLIVVYTGVEQFLRLEFEKKGNSTVIYKMDSHYDRSTATITQFPSGPFPPIVDAVAILKTLLLRPSILIKTMEFEFAPPAENHCNAMAEFIYLLGNVDAPLKNVFRVRTLVTGWLTHQVVDRMIWKNVVDQEVLEEIVNDGLESDTECLVPRKVFDEISTYKGTQVQYRETRIWMTDRRQETPVQLIQNVTKEGFEGLARVRFGSADDFSLFDHQVHPVTRLNEKVLLKRRPMENNGYVIRWNKSACGVWTEMVKLENEKKFEQLFKNETCGLGYLCETHGDPFDYWFYRTLPRRAYHEPEWLETAIHCQEEGMDEELKEVTMDRLKKLREIYGKEDAEKKRNGEKSMGPKSWGFYANDNVEELRSLKI